MTRLRWKAKLLLWNLCVLLIVQIPTAAWSGPKISVLGLFKGRAILRIDGKQRILKVGERSPEGVLLFAADADAAQVEVAGERHILALSHHIGSHFTPVAKDDQVTLTRSAQGMYVAAGMINGSGFDMVVDTGATYVAMNSQHAKQIGLPYRTKGKVVRMSTASGYSDGYKLKLRNVRVGGIEVKDVDAVIHDGAFPQQILLGMSFLGKLDIEHRTSGVLVLKQRR